MIFRNLHFTKIAKFGINLLHERYTESNFMTQQFLTDTLVRNLICPKGKQQHFIWDAPISTEGKIRQGAVGGLGVRVTQSGKRSFVHTYHFNGKRKRLVIGDAAIMNVDSARNAVRKRELEIVQGEDPMKTNINYKRPHTITVHEMIDEYFSGKLVRYSKNHQHRFRALIAPWVIPRSDKINGGPARNKMKAFGSLYRDMAAEQVSPRLIMSFVNSINSDYQANAALQHLRALFNWSMRMQIIDMRNPCDPIELRRITRKKREYTLLQIKQITSCIFHPPLEAFPSHDGLTGDEKRDTARMCGQIKQANNQLIELCNFMGILLLTMARPAELKKAKFEHFDLEQKIWHKHDTKGLKLSRAISEYGYRSVPIHERVVDLVIAQRMRWPESELLFPCHTDQARPRDNFTRSLKRFKALPDVPDYFQLYDLKRIAISLMLTGQGVSREAVSHYVDHKGNLETTMIYDLGLVEPLRPVTQRLAELLEV